MYFCLRFFFMVIKTTLYQEVTDKETKRIELNPGYKVVKNGH